MKFDEEKKETIRKYILEKIAQNSPSLAKTTAETFDVNKSTISLYIKELTAEQIIRKCRRGEYELISHEYAYLLERSKGELDDDMYALERCLRVHIETLAKNVQEIWDYAFSEMINNVMDHSLAENVRILVIQDYMSTKVMIADDGIGIFRKIQEYFHFQSVDEAICELFKGKLTTDSRNHSGEGIFFTSKLMDDFFICSGGRIFTNNRYDDSRITELVRSDQKGTCVFMSLSNFSRKTAKEIFDAYANSDGGFVKTTIPLKNIFDSSPVSRSQAKRICNRLDIFSKVIVDFDGISWIGQAFAHQLFVVFANSHPEIELTPVNMNKDVAKMYNHVRSTLQKPVSGNLPDQT